MRGQILNLLKYTKQRILRKPRYLLTMRVREALRNGKHSFIEPDGLEQIKRFLRFNLIEVFNDSFVYKYNFRRVRVYFDHAKDLYYVYTPENRRLYFKRGMSKQGIVFLYNSLCKEQDVKSPHYYFFERLNLSQDSIIGDIGGAEGNFSLFIVDKVKRIYLFECDEAWKEALEATFEPWKEKVHIITKYVSDLNTIDSVTLDDYFEDKEAPTLLKIDVEGAEAKVLDGAACLVQQNKISELLVCTYHQTNDSDILSKKLKGYHYHISFSKGYMFFPYIKEGLQAQPPYDFRRGLLYARVDL